VNAKTASASEIFVAALRAHGLAKVIGMPTFGKAIMEETFTLSNDYRVKFIVGSLYEPRGNSWQGGGLRPDIRVDLPAAELKRLEKLAPGDRVKRDPQLLAAWKILQ